MLYKSKFVPGEDRDTYFAIIDKYRAKPYAGGERHHVIPKSLGGEPGRHNTVLVPTKVHYKLHQLLTLVCKRESDRLCMVRALWCMSNGRYRKEKVSPKKYAEAREVWAALMSQNNPMHKPEIAQQFKRSRPEQSAIATAVNSIRWEKIHVPVTCAHCGTKSTLVVTRKKKIRPDWCCTRSCYSFQAVQNESEETKKKRLRSARRAGKKKRGIPAWNKGLANPTAAENGRKGAAKLAAAVTGRKREYRKDGSWFWVKPDSQMKVAA